MVLVWFWFYLILFWDGGGKKEGREEREKKKRITKREKRKEKEKTFSKAGLRVRNLAALNLVYSSSSETTTGSPLRWGMETASISA